MPRRSARRPVLQRFRGVWPRRFTVNHIRKGLTLFDDPRSWAHFELCKPGTMLLMPSEHVMPVMKADYAAMRNMIYGDYPSFDEILRIIKQLESEINSSL